MQSSISAVEVFIANTTKLFFSPKVPLLARYKMQGVQRKKLIISILCLMPCLSAHALVNEGIATEARGRGLMCAIELNEPNGGDVVLAMLERGFLVNNTSATTIRFLPPLVITGDELTNALNALRDVLADD